MIHPAIVQYQNQVKIINMVKIIKIANMLRNHPIHPHQKAQWTKIGNQAWACQPPTCGSTAELTKIGLLQIKNEAESGVGVVEGDILLEHHQ